MREPLVALASKDHFMDLPNALSLKHLTQLPLLVMQGMPIIVLHAEQMIPMLLTEFLESAGRPLSIACSVRQAATLVDLAASGLGIGIVPRLAIPTAMSSKIRIHPIIEPEIVRDIGVATLKDETLSEPSLALAEIFKEQLTKKILT